MNQLNELKTLAHPRGSQVIHFSQDEYGRILVVDDGKQRILNFDSLFEQSCMQLSHPNQLVHQYTRAMALAVAFIDPVHITCLGLGGGSLLRALHHALSQCTFHVIELRQAVANIARAYFSIPGDQRVRITVNDAFQEIVRIDSGSTDIIFADMYDAYRMAPEQIHKSFLRECARVLTPQGLLVINLHDLPRDRSGFSDMLGEIFPTLLLRSATDNTVLYAGRSEPAMIAFNTGRIEAMETLLQQRLRPLLAGVKPLNASITGVSKKRHFPR